MSATLREPAHRRIDAAMVWGVSVATIAHAADADKRRRELHHQYR
jgi:hypothetical protein